MSGERGSGISVLMTCHDIYIYIYIYSICASGSYILKSVYLRQQFKFNFVIGMCRNENVVYIADIYVGFSYYCSKYFVFDERHVEIGNGRT